MQAFFSQLTRVTASDVTVLIHGESGTGKELAARALHEGSARASGPFIALNCAAIPESLQESEFFGHERGSFTGAVGQRKGVLELANHGTLFLDEVGELGASLQPKLLRSIQERTFHRVGGSQVLSSDFRLVTATHRNLSDEVEAGRFRADLFFRLTVFELELPPLRERHGDLPLLARAFVDASARDRSVVIGPDAMEAINGYEWPGNVRELENAILRALVVCQNDRITAADLPTRVRRAPPLTPRTRPAAATVEDHGSPIPQSMDNVERRALEDALAHAKGNVSEAARTLGIGRTTAYRLMRKFGIRGSE
jgi:DNA-binding NtrC family response regulator